MGVSISGAFCKSRYQHPIYGMFERKKNKRKNNLKEEKLKEIESQKWKKKKREIERSIQQ